MGRIKSQNFYETQTERYIFALVFKDKHIYINNVTKKSFKSIYNNHLNGGCYVTAKYISELQDSEMKLCMIKLDELYCSKSEAFARQLVWTRYFIDNDYTIINEGLIQEYAMDLFENNKSFYEEIKNKPIDEQLSCSNCLVKCSEQKGAIYG